MDDSRHADLIACARCGRWLDPAEHTVPLPNSSVPAEEVTWGVVTRERPYSVRCPDCGITPSGPGCHENICGSNATRTDGTMVPVCRKRDTKK